MADETSALPSIVTDVSDLIASTDGADASDPTVTDGEAYIYGSSFSFDWQTMRLRTDASGNPVVVTGQESIVEDVVKALLTPRYRYPLYSDDYGAEFWELLGTDRELASTDVVRILTEVCTLDPRVRSVEDIDVQNGPNASLIVRFILDVDEIGRAHV